MIGLTLLACHMLGDFVIQNRWMTPAKFTSRRARTIHVATYCLPFVPVAAVFGTWDRPSNSSGFAFLAGLFVLHWLTDSRRFQSNLGDVVQWWITEHRLPRRHRIACEPNPWDALPILIDQSLHLAQLAALGWLLT